MLRWVANLLLGGASGACGLAAAGTALYAGSPAQASAAALFAGFGFVAGLLCGGLHAVFDGLPSRPAAALPPEALASLVRATLATATATATAERAPRSGSAADRRPSPAQVASTALADAAARSMSAAAAPAAPAVPAASVASAVPQPPVDQRRFASSEFGA
jgi:hypothetical protein